MRARGHLAPRFYPHQLVESGGVARCSLLCSHRPTLLRPLSKKFNRSSQDPTFRNHREIPFLPQGADLGPQRPEGRYLPPGRIRRCLRQPQNQERQNCPEGSKAAFFRKVRFPRSKLPGAAYATTGFRFSSKPCRVQGYFRENRQPLPADFANYVQLGHDRRGGKVPWRKESGS